MYVTQHFTLPCPSSKSTMMHTTDRRSEGKDFGCTTGIWDVAGSYTDLDIWDNNNNYCCYPYYYDDDDYY